MPTFNGEKYIARAIDSILTQTHRNLELIIVDDGSTDNTPSIIKSIIASKKEQRIKYTLHEQNQGVSAATNTALANVRGAYIFPMDHDDVALPTRIETSLKFLKRNPELSGCGALHTKLSRFNLINKFKIIKTELSAKPVSAEVVAAGTLFGGKLFNPTVCFTKEALNLVSEKFRTDLKVGADTDFYARLIQKGAKFAIIPKVVTLYRRHGKNTSLQYPKIAAANRINISERAVLDLVPAASSEELKLHSRLVVRDKTIASEDLPRLRTWFLSLLGSCEEKGVKEGLRQILAYQWSQACALAACANLKTGWKEYYTIPELNDALPTRLALVYFYQKRKIMRIFKGR